MLLHSPRRPHQKHDIDSIHNFYERLVIDAVHNHSDRAKRDPDFLADVACVALNHLPPKYIRYDVDMTFFMSPQEQAEIKDKVVAAVKLAIDYVGERARSEADAG